MKSMVQIGQGSVLLAFIAFASGCIVEPRNDYYDRDHHRYYHEHNWHDCGEHDDHCH